MVALIGLSILTVIVLQRVGVLSDDYFPTFTARNVLLLSIASYAAMLAAVAVAVLPLGARALGALGVRRAGWRPIVFGAVGTVILSVAVSQVGIEPQGVKKVLEFVRQPGELGLSLLALAILAPLVEELIFRGLVYGWIAGSWMWVADRWSRLPSRYGTVAAWLVSSLVFAVAHAEPAHVLLVLPLGLLFGWLRRRTDSLVPSLVAHVVNNGFTLIASTYLGG